jgi:transcriptional regulator with XRE-family HTH domain
VETFPEFKYLASNVRRIRTALGLTQEQLAEAAGCGLAVVARLERADNAATILSILKIARALETPVIELLEPAEWTAPYRGRPRL